MKIVITGQKSFGRAVLKRLLEDGHDILGVAVAPQHIPTKHNYKNCDHVPENTVNFGHFSTAHDCTLKTGKNSSLITKGLRHYACADSTMPNQLQARMRPTERFLSAGFLPSKHRFHASSFQSQHRPVLLFQQQHDAHRGGHERKSLAMFFRVLACVANIHDLIMQTHSPSPLFLAMLPFRHPSICQNS